MKTHLDSDPNALRRAAEARLKDDPAARPPHTEADLRRLQSELEVHEIELEMQNQELRATELKLVAALARYTDHFDFAPVGYFNLTADGTIKLVNLTGATFVGIERDRLVGRHFEWVVTEADRHAFGEFLARVFRTGDRESFEIDLLRPDQPARCGLLEATLSPDGHECRLVLIDITERKQKELTIQRQADELRAQNDFLANWQRLNVDRELRMTQLKRDINELNARLGEAPRYPTLVPGVDSGPLPTPPTATETPG